RAELVHHRIDRVLQLQNFTAYVDGNLAREITVSYCGGDFGDVADLGRQVGGHRVDRVSQIVPYAADVLYRCLTAQLAFRTHFPSHARHFAGERTELIHHGVDGVLEF